MIAALLFAAAPVALSADAALAAIAACAAKGQTVSAAVVGSEGEVRALLRGDGAPPHSLESAQRKAYTAASFGQPTEELATLVNSHPDAAGLTRLDGTLFVGGGLPILAGGKAVGGIGVAGGNGPGIDEDCARAGLARLGGETVSSPGPMRYLALFARFYFGIHCLTSGANYFLQFSRTGKMLDPATIQFQEAITAIGIYPAVKTLELIVGICVLSGVMLPLALVLEFPVSIMILSLGAYQGINIHLLTAFKEVALNAILFAAYAGYYLRILAPRARQLPLWDAGVRAEAAAFYREQAR